MNLSSKIAKARERAGLTQQQLAARAGVSPSYVSRLENGSRGRIQDQKLGAILEALGLSLEVVHAAPYAESSSGISDVDLTPDEGAAA